MKHRFVVPVLQMSTDKLDSIKCLYHLCNVRGPFRGKGGTTASTPWPWATILALENASTRAPNPFPLTPPRQTDVATPNQRVGGNVEPALGFAPLGWNRCCGALLHHQSRRVKNHCLKNCWQEGPRGPCAMCPCIVQLSPSAAVE